jgi:DNA-binding MarR family transcriptional regulator
METPPPGDAAPALIPVLDLDNFLPYRLLVVTSQVTRVFAHRYQKEFGITIPESRVINALGRKSPLSSWEICERTTMTKTRVSVAIKNLVNTGLLTKKTDLSDQRQLQVALTRKGNKLRERIAVVALELEQDIVARCGSDGREQLMALLDAIHQDATSLPT